MTTKLRPSTIMVSGHGIYREYKGFPTGTSVGNYVAVPGHILDLQADTDGTHVVLPSQRHQQSTRLCVAMENSLGTRGINPANTDNYYKAGDTVFTVFPAKGAVVQVLLATGTGNVAVGDYLELNANGTVRVQRITDITTDHDAVQGIALGISLEAIVPNPVGVFGVELIKMEVV